MYHLAKKNFLCHNMNKMYNVFPEEYNFSPQTWTLPAGLPDLKAYFEQHQNTTFIAKPESGS